ncbi:hypothetical protein [Curtobacterium sp. BH-2-1-1]|uniref:hypothetical protein n=2 Tax=Curtobacterium TaxID=2034 RepID=UPI0011AAA0BB|nr:hypothetical protein [Curtobacterium sp. BH-2-1-1]
MAHALSNRLPRHGGEQMLTWITTLVLERSTALPQTVSLGLTAVVWASVVAVLSSVPASLARSTLYDTERRLDRRYRRLFDREHGFVSSTSAARVANRALYEASLLERSVSVLDRFGGHVVFWPHAVRPFQVFRLGALCAGVVLAVISWPAEWSWQPGDVWDQWSALMPRWDDVKLALPIVLVLLGLFAVSSRTPLLDRIRARDEAAKDANRLLARWAFGAAELWEVALRRAEDVHRLSGVIVDERCRTLIPGTSYSRGIVVDLRDGGDIVTWHRLGKELRDPQSLEESMERLRDLNEEIRRAGLRYVAWNLVPSATSFIHRSGFDWLYSSPQSRSHAYLDDDGLRRMCHGWLSNWHRDDYERNRGVDGPGAELARDQLSERARTLELQLEVAAVMLLFRAGSLRVAHDRISRRMLGNPWTKLLSVAKS